MVVTAAAEAVVEVAVTELVPITEPILDWTGVKLDPTHFPPNDYRVHPPSNQSDATIQCYPHCGAWILPIAWRESSYWMYWGRQYNSHFSGDWHMPVQLFRDVGEIRRNLDAKLAEVARLNQSLGGQTLDLDEIRQRHLGGDAQALPEGHVLADLARLIAEVESYRRAPTLPEPPKAPVAEAPKYPDEIPF